MMDNMDIYDITIPERILTREDIVNGVKIYTKYCRSCGSENIKTSKKGNEYCADLCWVDNSTERKVGR